MARGGEGGGDGKREGGGEGKEEMEEEEEEGRKMVRGEQIKGARRRVLID